MKLWKPNARRRLSEEKRRMLSASELEERFFLASFTGIEHFEGSQRSILEVLLLHGEMVSFGSLVWACMLGWMRVRKKRRQFLENLKIIER